MVEKWLLQVQDGMKESIATAIQEAALVYRDTERTEWLQAWPGQIVLCVSSIYWTADVTAALVSDVTLKVAVLLFATLFT